MTRQLAATDAQSLRSQRLAMAMAGLALMLGLLFTGAGVFWVNNTFQSQARERFDRLADRVQTDVQDRLNAPLLGLRGAAGVYAASNTVERAEFRAYVQFSQLGRDFPGVRGFGFMTRVLREDLDRFIAAERADDEPAFAVSAMPGSPTTPSAPDLYVVKFMEPQARNQAALGLDVGADPLRREAIERAVATGEPTLTRKTTLVQDQQQSPGWVYLLPVYRPGADLSTPAQRQALLIGVLFAPMLVSEVLQGAAEATQGQADFELFDAEPLNAQTRVYALDGHLAAGRGDPVTDHAAQRLFSTSRPVLAGGRTLTLRVSTTPAFEAEAASLMPALLGLSGVLLSLLLALCLWLLGSSRARALSVAQRMTLDLAHEQQRLLSIVEGTNVGTWEWNVQTGETRFDERWAAITGHTLDEMLPLNIQTWRDLTHPGDLLHADGLLKQHFAGRTPYFDCEVRLRHKDGRWIWVLSRGRVCAWGGDRQPALMAGTLMDITERQTAQLALRNSEEHFRQLFETSLECILQTRPDGQVLNANAAACELFGMSVEELRERGRGGLVDPGDTRLQALLDERQREGKTRGELRMLRGDGTAFECELSSSIFLDSNNTPCANIVLRDITVRKRSEARIALVNAELEQRVGRRTAQLEASNRDLQEFAHSVAHDLRQPFIAIGGFSGLLERRVTDDRARHYINRIKAGVRQAGELTEALLALANLSRVQLRVQAVDLSAVAHSVMDSLQLEEPARARRIRIQEGLVVQADAMLLRLVMQELLGNAWKFTSRQTHTEISFGLQSAPAAGVEAVYVVSDNGEGFDMAHVDKLFRSFQRLHAPQEFPGAGVGLANIQRIITRHGGQIWAESARGEGARFFFTLGSPGV
ncbi:MAG: CHASE domain-containing protein [Polaromonas sp.]|uniref:CHASE domain-containing protein n=1 Tax=Polaromonas sp. TaxID=1869339 RepID=UPI002726EBAC|nr:CHASE domain-containing protein [Polaromonas sp.]MDO9113624.1 CHASE domain-containing protein [Polaromonas sp.]MDP1885238.1 CHASE domain-containing protein [Polaromonas sp.]